MKYIALFAIIFLVVGYLLIRPLTAAAGSVTVAWEPNSEPDLKGYKIYVGLISRMVTTTEAMQTWCIENEPTNSKCVAQWEAICKDKDDQACHSWLHGYNRVIDVGNATEYEILGLEEGKTYYLAATAYDKDDNESAFSVELIHTPEYYKPKTASGFRHKRLQISW
jgi:hypothetical protein